MNAFVYTELQISVPFEDAPFATVNQSLLKQPGLLNKTWLSGVKTNSLGGLYAFDTIENAKKFVTGYFPEEAKSFGVAQTTRVFDAAVVEEASRASNSMHFGGEIEGTPGAFVYTEVQVNVPFESAPWEAINEVSTSQPGFMAKTWLSGVDTNTVGGLYAFDTVDNARAFATDVFPREAAGLNAAFYTRVFDASQTGDASREMRSPFFH